MNKERMNRKQRPLAKTSSRNFSIEEILSGIHPLRILQTGVRSSADIRIALKIGRYLKKKAPEHFMFYVLAQTPEAYEDTIHALRAGGLLDFAQVLVGATLRRDETLEEQYEYLPDCLLDGCLKDLQYDPDMVILGTSGMLQMSEMHKIMQLTRAPIKYLLASAQKAPAKHKKSALARFGLSLEGFCTDARLALWTYRDAIPPVPRQKSIASMKPEKPQGRRKTAIVLIEHMGDIVACEPVSRYLRDKDPESHITWVVREEYRQLVENNPNIDEVLTVDCLTEWSLLARSGLYDEIIDLHINNRDCPRCAVRFKKWTTAPEITLENYYDHGPLLSTFSRCAGLPPLKEAPRVYIPDFVREKVDCLCLPEKFIVLHCTSNEYERDWAEEKWKEWIRRLEHVWDGALVEVGAKASLAGYGGAGVIDLCGDVSILESAEIIRRASAFVGVDSGPAHLANAVGTYGIILLGRYHAFERYLPYTGDFGAGKNSEILYARKAPARSISVHRVLKATLKALSAVEKSGTKKSPKTETGWVSGKRAIIRAETDARLIAFYLPQFHPTPENDLWWGRGFTEWRNVAKAKPLYEGHYQPHVPGELGFYDLRMPEVMTRQAELARAAGIEAFCFWHYWFNGMMLLERPILNLLETGKPDFPFCLAWANENWTRRWDGQENEILMQQSYGGPSDDGNHFRWLARAFRDPRYLKIEGRPIFLIYRPLHLQDPAGTISRWRKIARSYGIPRPYLIAMRTNFNGRSSVHPLEMGFDAELDFQPNSPRSFHRIQASVAQKQKLFPRLYDEEIRLLKEKGATICDYDEAWPIFSESAQATPASYSTIVPAWDNSPRRADQGAFILNRSTPSSYQRWLRYEIQRCSDKPPERRLVFINAWNEWAEGNHLEPDLRHGAGYLESTRRALQNHRRRDTEASELLRQAKRIARIQPLARRIVRSIHKRIPASSEENAKHRSESVLKYLEDAVLPIARSGSLERQKRSAMAAAMRGLLKIHESFPLIVQFYNYASGLGQNGKKAEARLMFSLLAEITNQVFPDICGKCHYKLALLSARKRERIAHLSSCIFVYPKHRAAAELLDALTKKTMMARKKSTAACPRVKFARRIRAAQN
jgi:ADP-heptose:LPS heptosyltransferase